MRRLILLAHIFIVFFLITGCDDATEEANAEDSRFSAATPVTINKRIVCEGDSRTNMGDAPGSPGDLTGYPAQLAGLLHANYYKDGVRVIFDPANMTEVVNVGLSGDTAQRILLGEMRQVDPYITENSETIYILDAGGNDIVNSRRTAQQVLGDIKKIRETITAKGATVYTATIGNAGVPPMYRKTAVAVNNGIRALYKSGKANGKVVDYWAVPQLSKSTDKTYFLPDQVHYTAAGHEIKARTVLAALNDAPSTKN